MASHQSILTKGTSKKNSVMGFKKSVTNKAYKKTNTKKKNENVAIDFYASSDDENVQEEFDRERVDDTIKNKGEPEKKKKRDREEVYDEDLQVLAGFSEEQSRKKVKANVSTQELDLITEPPSDSGIIISDEDVNNTLEDNEDEQERNIFALFGHQDLLAEIPEQDPEESLIEGFKVDDIKYPLSAVQGHSTYMLEGVTHYAFAINDAVKVGASKSQGNKFGLTSSCVSFAYNSTPKVAAALVTAYHYLIACIDCNSKDVVGDENENVLEHENPAYRTILTTADGAAIINRQWHPTNDNKFSSQIDQGSIKWTSKQDIKGWVNMKGSLCFRRFEELYSLIKAIVTVAPCVAPYPPAFIKGYEKIVERLMEQSTESIMREYNQQWLLNTWNNNMLTAAAIWSSKEIRLSLNDQRIYIEILKNNVSLLSTFYVLKLILKKLPNS